MSRRKFTANFKLNAIKLGEEKQNISQAARELGVKASLIHRWKREQQDFSHNSFPGDGKVKMTTESTVVKAWYIAVRNRPIKNTLIFGLV